MDTRKKLSIAGLLGLLLIAGSSTDLLSFVVLFFMMRLLNPKKISIKGHDVFHLTAAGDNIKNIIPLPLDEYVIATDERIDIVSASPKNRYRLITQGKFQQVVSAPNNHLFVLVDDRSFFVDLNTKKSQPINGFLVGNAYNWLLDNTNFLGVNNTYNSLFNVRNPTQPKVRQGMIFKFKDDITPDDGSMSFFLLSNQHLLSVYYKKYKLYYWTPILIMRLEYAVTYSLILPRECFSKDGDSYNVSAINNQQFAFQVSNTILIYHLQDDMYQLQKKINLDKNIIIKHFTMLKDEEHFLIMGNKQFKIFSLITEECIETVTIKDCDNVNNTKLWALPNGDVAFAHSRGPQYCPLLHIFRFNYRDLRYNEILNNTPLATDLVKMVREYSYEKSPLYFFNQPKEKKQDNSKEKIPSCNFRAPPCHKRY
jgi:hypothetical protein